MTRLVLSLVAVTLWIMSKTDSTHLSSVVDAVQKLLVSPASAHRKRNHDGEHSKGDPLPSMVTGDSLVSDKISSLEKGASPKEKCCDNSNVIDKFSSKFTATVLSSHELSDLFGVTLPPEEAQVAYDRIVFNAVDNVNTCFPRTVSRIVSDAILATFGNLTLNTHVQTYGLAAATHMKNMNVLTCENLNDLCDAYIFYVKQAACNVPHIKDRRIAYIQAVTDGMLHFLTSLDLYTAETVFSLAHDYANYLYLLTGVHQCNERFENIDETE